MKMPRLYDAHLGFLALQSAHTSKVLHRVRGYRNGVTDLEDELLTVSRLGGKV